jgi:regulatory protein
VRGHGRGATTRPGRGPDDGCGPAGAPGAHRDRAAARAETRERRAAVSEPGPVMDAAARFLEARPRSVDETRRRLVDAGYRADLVEAVLVRLSELGYLDDTAFARAWVESRDRAHPRGEAALRRELALKGIAPAVAGQVLDERRERVGAAAAAGAHLESPGEPDLDAARRVLDRRGRALVREPDPRKRRAKAYALLARHGFDPDACRAAVVAWLRTVEGVDEAGARDG